MSKPQDAVEDGLGALAALLQGVRVARLAQRLVVGAPVEGLAKEGIVYKYQIPNFKYKIPNANYLSKEECGTLGASKALNMVESTHRTRRRCERWEKCKMQKIEKQLKLGMMKCKKRRRVWKNLKRLKRLITPAAGAFTHDTRTAGNAAAEVIRIRAANKGFRIDSVNLQLKSKSISFNQLRLRPERTYDFKTLPVWEGFEVSGDPLSRCNCPLGHL